MIDKKRLALIDLDTLVFIVASRQWTNGNRDNPEQVKNHVKEYVNTILINTRADFYTSVYQAKGHSNYRKYFYPDYKANRPESPEFFIHWKDTIVEAFIELGAVGLKVIESDDAVSIGYYKYKDEYDCIIVSGDKDLNQIPGEHYNPSKNISYFVHEVDANINLMIQVLAGDDSDGIKGIYGIGAKWNYEKHQFDAPKARKILNSSNDVTRNIQEAYEVAYPSVERLDVPLDTYTWVYSDWYSKYLKCMFLVTLLKDINYFTYPFNEEVTELFNIVPVTTQVTTNLFD